MNLQTKVQHLLNQLADSPQEHGLQVAVYRQGELVVDACAGYKDASHSEAVASDTLFPAFSCSKGIASTIIHQLAEAGKVDYDSAIADYWPAFSAKAKGNITLRHVLNHVAGLWPMPSDADISLVSNWEAACTAIAEMEAKHAPGERTEYHAITFGWIVGNVVCRVTGLSFPELIKKEICEPLGIRDLYIGMPDSEAHRVATLYEDVQTDEFIAPNDAKAESIPAYVKPLHAMMNRPDMRAASIPATSGIMTARALAKHYASLLPGGVDGVQLLPNSRVQLATQRPNYPHLSDESASFLMGYGTVDSWNIPGKAQTFGHGGYGGSIGFADPNRHLAVAITKNYFNQLNHTEQILKAIEN